MSAKKEATRLYNEYIHLKNLQIEKSKELYQLKHLQLFREEANRVTELLRYKFLPDIEDFHRRIQHVYVIFPDCVSTFNQPWPRIIHMIKFNPYKEEITFRFTKVRDERRLPREVTFTVNDLIRWNIDPKNANDT